MTTALLTKAERLRQEQSRNRETVIRLNKKGDTETGLTDEERAELGKAVDRLETIEPEKPRRDGGGSCGTRRA